MASSRTIVAGPFLRLRQRQARGVAGRFHFVATSLTCGFSPVMIPALLVDEVAGVYPAVVGRAAPLDKDRAPRQPPGAVKIAGVARMKRLDDELSGTAT